MKKEKNMNYIDLESVGSTITNEGIVFPQDCSEPPVTASDADEMMGVHIMDCCDEWWSSLSCQEAVTLFSFLAEIPELYYSEGYMSWAVGRGDFVAESNGFNTLVVASIEEGWTIEDCLWSPTEMAVA